MARRRLPLRRPRGPVEILAAGVLTLAGTAWLLQTATTAGRAAVRHWPVLALTALTAALAAAAWWLRRRAAARARTRRLATLRLSLPGIDALSDQDFEFVLRDLLVRDGWTARQVGRQGDQAADVIGDHPRLGRIVVQAKHTTTARKVSSHVMYQVKGTAGPVHHADCAVVVTNGSFTRDARAWGDKHHIHWVDRDRLRAWAEHGIALHDLLHLPARAARRPRHPRPPDVPRVPEREEGRSHA
ncbi:restriction endonuclease [Kitasatospora herbaricolor]|uniref:restriction endonuclease n=1 Tax=Kitasatospora herbaricolor TaxID=68217 RepID=UPI0036D77C82